MKADGHSQKANEIKASLQKLLPDPEGKNVVAIVELTYGIVQHLIAAGMEKIHQIHSDTHVGLPHLLREHGEDEIAKVFERLDFSDKAVGMVEREMGMSFGNVWK